MQEGRTCKTLELSFYKKSTNETLKYKNKFVHWAQPDMTSEVEPWTVGENLETK